MNEMDLEMDLSVFDDVFDESVFDDAFAEEESSALVIKPEVSIMYRKWIVENYRDKFYEYTGLTLDDYYGPSDAEYRRGFNVRRFCRDYKLAFGDTQDVERDVWFRLGKDAGALISYLYER